MNPIIIALLTIPALLSFVLIVLFLKEMYNYRAGKKESFSTESKKKKDADSDEFFKNYRDFSGGMLGI